MTSFIIALVIGIAVIVGGFVVKDMSQMKLTTATSTTVASTTVGVPFPDSDYKKSQIMIENATFNALVADTDVLQTQGLSDRTGLAANQAMLFVFPAPDMLGFWMKDMLFSIDMVWLDAKERVVSYQSDATPQSYPKIFFPAGLSQYVIELPAGTVARLGLKTGDQVVISNS